jgi:hypothetical protein
MLLRDHPLMSRYGVPNWPPVWTWVDGPEIDGPQNKSLKGEVGIFRWVGLSGIQPPDRCYLYIDHEGRSDFLAHYTNTTINGLVQAPLMARYDF